MGGYAWVTLATNDSYSLGALVLAHSLRKVATTHKLAILITPGVTAVMREKLNTVFDLIQEVNILDSKDETNLRLLRRPELGITFTKLHCWRLTQFEKCVFLDADTMVLENCDELFEREELSAAPDVGWPDCFNSGVFVFKPSLVTFDSLIEFALEKGSFDGGDQGLLNLYFSDWAQKDISKHLPFIYNMCSTACYSYLPAFKQFGQDVKIVHFIGPAKPWLQYFNSETRQVAASQGLQHLQVVLQLWWDIFCQNVHPILSPAMARSSTPAAHGPSYYQIQNITTDFENYIHDEDFNEPPIITLDYRDAWDPWDEYELTKTAATIETVIESIKHNQVTDLTTSSDNKFPIKVDNPNITEEFNFNRSNHTPSPPLHSNKTPPPSPQTCEAASSTDDTTKIALYSTNEQTNQDAGLAGAFAQLTLGEPRSPGQSALEDHLRRQDWEVGNIDYMGRDAFDNIWKKICHTLSTPPPSAPSLPPSAHSPSPRAASPPPSTPGPQPSAPTPAPQPTAPATAEQPPKTEPIVEQPVPTKSEPKPCPAQPKKEETIVAPPQCAPAPAEPIMPPVKPSPKPPAPISKPNPVPRTPVVTEATPPTSPPIGALPKVPATAAATSQAPALNVSAVAPETPPPAPPPRKGGSAKKSSKSKK